MASAASTNFRSPRALDADARQHEELVVLPHEHAPERGQRHRQQQAKAGAAAGIGKAAALAFARLGYRLAVTDLEAESGPGLLAELRAAGGDARYVVADPAEMLAAVMLLEQSFGARLGPEGVREMVRQALDAALSLDEAQLARLRSQKQALDAACSAVAEEGAKISKIVNSHTTVTHNLTKLVHDKKMQLLKA